MLRMQWEGHKASVSRKKTKTKPNNKVNIVLSKKEMEDRGKRKYVNIKINK